MPLQNRVTPFGELVAIPERGLLTGNRGVLIDDERRLVRRWQVKRWIACQLEFRGYQRQVMTPRRWTELFFLDEATALAAGHRPCAHCRHADYQRFRSAWAAAQGGEVPGADAMDSVLHAERLDGRAKRVSTAALASLPDGSLIADDGGAWLVLGDRLGRWSAAGYGDWRTRPARMRCDVLTPPSTVAVLAAGYGCALHPSALS